MKSAPLTAILSCAALAACTTAPRQQIAVPQVALPPSQTDEPVELAGLQPQQLRVAFGSPALVRKDGRVEMWRYDSTACKAFFFLYPAGATLEVRHVETVPRGREFAADEGCLDALRARPAAPVS